MPEPSPDPAVPRQSAQGAAAPPPSAPPSPPSRPPQQRDVQPRRFGVVAIGIFFLFLLLVVVVGAVLAGNEGAAKALSDSLGIETDIRGVIFTFIEVIYGIAAMVSIIFMLVGGFRAATSLGDQRQAARGRRTLFIALGTLIFLFASFVVFYQILGAPEPDAPPPAVTVEVTPCDGGAVPCEVLFRVTSSYDATTARYDWNFGDGTSYSPPPPGSASHTYDKPSPEGEPFKAVLTVYVSGLEVERLTEEVAVSKAKAIAKFTTIPESGRGPAPLEVDFDAAGSRAGPGAGPDVTYTWDFGEAIDPSATPEKQLPRMRHKYVREGTYTVRLTVTDDQGQTATAEEEIVVEPSRPIPLAHIKTSPPLRDLPSDVDDPKNPDRLPFTSGLAPFSVSFSGATSESPNGNIREYHWSYGDGSDPGRGRSQTHLYERIGQYVVELTVTDEEGEVGRTRILVDVQAQQRAPVARIETAPRANGGALIGTVPFRVSFNGLASTDEDGRIQNYRWDFGDRTQPADGDRVEHTFALQGEYFVSLVVTDDTDLDSEPATLQVKVNPGKCDEPKALMVTTPSVPTGIVPFVVEFDGSASTMSCGSIVRFEWNFGDDSPRVSSGAKVTHIYKEAGLYTAELVVTGADGKLARAQTTVSVREPPPQAKIEVDRTVVDAGSPVSFRGDSSLGNIQSWYWDFNDGTAETGRTLQHTFATPNFYTVKLIVTDVYNQTSTATIRIEVN